MKSIQRDQVLRLNCPGFGEESYLTIGKAKPLDNYDVIIANPVSILHLFDREPDVLKEIDGKLDEGLTSFTLKNDSLLQALESDLKKRIFELVSFLERGGLLVYYLCRPFLLQGASLSMDNYFWLESLAPDTPVENNVRHMSAVSHGRTIEPTDQADKSEFASYFQQTGLEWNTIIRTDFLTEGYIVLATAGPRKCIAAHLIAGDNGGRIIFLPAPYSPDFDRTLMDCVNGWYAKRSGEPAPVPVGAKAGAGQQKFPQPDNSFLKPETSSASSSGGGAKSAPGAGHQGPASSPLQAPATAVAAAASAPSVGTGSSGFGEGGSIAAAVGTQENTNSELVSQSVTAGGASTQSPSKGSIGSGAQNSAASGMSEQSFADSSAIAARDSVSSSRTGVPSQAAPTNSRTGIPAQAAAAPTNSRTGIPAQSAPTNSRTGIPAQASPTNSRTGIPAQASPTTSRTGIPAQSSPSSSRPGMPAQDASGLRSGASISDSPSSSRSGIPSQGLPSQGLPSTSRTGIPAQPPGGQIQSSGISGSPNSSRTGLPSQNPTTSRTGLPPVQKFDARVSRSQPQGPVDTDNAKKKMTAEEILESVSAQAEVVEAPADKQPFNERTTTDIGTAFNSLNQPLPQHNAEQAGVPSAADLLKELESVGTKNPNQAEHADLSQSHEDDHDTEESGSRNLLAEMESLAGPIPSNPSVNKAPEPISDKASTDFTNYKFAGEDIGSGAAPSLTPRASQRGDGGATSSTHPEAAPTASSSNNNHDTETPEAKDLMKKMEEMTKTVPTEWCAEYSFSDLDDLRREKTSLTDSIKQAQTKIASIDSKISQLEGLKNSLLAADGDELVNACALVFNRLGWGTTHNSDASNELLLSADRPEAIVRVMRTNGQPKSSDVAQLAQSVITFWGEHEVEPKGVLVSCTWANRPPNERSEPDYTDALAEFAQKKNLTLMTTMQLLCIYRDMEMGKTDGDEVRKRILETNGKLTGYSLEHSMVKATAG